MLIILEKGRRAYQMQQISQCYDMLADLLTPEQLLAWELPEANPAVVARRMVDLAVGADVTVQTVWRQHVDNIGDQSRGGIASCGNPDTAEG